MTTPTDRDTLADLPTTPGSVIQADADFGEYGFSGETLWRVPTGWRDMNGSLFDGSVLTLVRVLFDAGATPMTADSVPAPTVQHEPSCHLMNPCSCTCGAATPAASVPAADQLEATRRERDDYLATLKEDTRRRGVLIMGIERLAGQWEERAMTCCTLMCQNCGARYIDPDDLRVLVAAAEQADKGEAADTARDDEDEWAEDRSAHAWDTSAPAAPPEPLCRCGHKVHGYKPIGEGGMAFNGCQTYGCPCTRFDPPAPARVPVKDGLDANPSGRPSDVSDGHNDEAEAQTAAEVWHKWVLDEEPALPPEWWDITRRAVAAGFRAARQGGNSDD